jgi:hypothetical protein
VDGYIGVVRGTWQRLLGSLVSAAAFFICSCRVSGVNLVVSHASKVSKVVGGVNLVGGHVTVYLIPRATIPLTKDQFTYNHHT